MKKLNIKTSLYIKTGVEVADSDSEGSVFNVQQSTLCVAL